MNSFQLRLQEQRDTKQANRDQGMIRRFCAGETKTVYHGEDGGDFDIKTPRVKDESLTRWKFSDAQKIVTDETNRLARRSEPVTVPAYTEPGYTQALCERTLQIVAQNRVGRN